MAIAKRPMTPCAVGVEDAVDGDMMRIWQSRGVEGRSVRPITG